MVFDRLPFRHNHEVQVTKLTFGDVYTFAYKAQGRQDHKVTMDVERMQRLGSLVAIGIASQVSAEFMASRSSTHSFWILVGVSLVMMIIQVVFQQLNDLGATLKAKSAQSPDKPDTANWLPWVHILVSLVF